MAHKHSVNDTDQRFVIDPIEKVIINKSNRKIKLMQFDHNSERITFEIPRIVTDGHDISECDKIEMNYINVDAATKEFKADVYKVKDMQHSPDGDDVVIFSWLISKGCTGFAGTLNFLIVFKCMDGTIEEYAWHTDIYTELRVSGGMSNGEAVIKDYSDVLLYRPYDLKLGGVNHNYAKHIITLNLPTVTIIVLACYPLRTTR